jgi:hypothetical protein
MPTGVTAKSGAALLASFKPADPGAKRMVIKARWVSE